MPAATVTKMSYGYMLTGDTDATVVDSGAGVGVLAGAIMVKAIGFSGNATTATALITEGLSADNSALKFKCYDAGGGSLNAAGNFVFFGETGVPFTNMKVTLSNASDHVYIFVV